MHEEGIAGKEEGIDDFEQKGIDWIHIAFAHHVCVCVRVCVCVCVCA